MAGPIRQTGMFSVPTSDAKADGVGELSSLQKNTFDINTLRYPIEGLGDKDAPHYVVFNINLPESSKYITNDNASNVSSAYANNSETTGLHSNPLQSLTGTSTEVQTALATGAISALSPGGNFLSGATKGAVGSVFADNVSIKQKLNRIKTSIAIYMPETVITTYTHGWDALSMTEAMGLAGEVAALGGWKGATAFAESLGKGVITKNQPYNNIPAAEAAGRISELTGVTGKGFTDLALRSVNRAINPQVEMIFRGTKNREYVFEFDFQPKSQKEAKEIYNIIKAFKAYSSPEVASKGQGRYFIPPAVFDIKFYFKNAENHSIAKISTCALTQMAVNYNQSGQFASFNDGMPIHIHVALTFMEVDIITRELIEKYGY